MKRVFVTIALFVIAAIPWSSAVAAGGAATSGGKAGSTAAMAAKGSHVRPHSAVTVVRGFGGFRRFGSTRFDRESFLIVDATPAEAQVFLDGRLLGSARMQISSATDNFLEGTAVRRLRLRG